MSVQDLPQGALPPLPQLQEDEISRAPKTYPTVLQQHLNNMRKFKDCIILTRVGDFYEMYFDQVEEFAPLVGLKKARRATSLGDVPMAGFQRTQLDRYLKMFVQDLNKHVAISEQIPRVDGTRDKDSKAATRTGSGPVFDRKVVRIVTAGTLIDENFMDPYSNNYLLGIDFPDSMTAPQLNSIDMISIPVGLSWVDLSSGDFFTQVSDLASLASIIARISPREVIFDSRMESQGPEWLLKLTGDGAFSTHFHVKENDLQPSPADWTPLLEHPLSNEQQQSFLELEVTAASLVLDYLKTKILDTNIQLQPPVRRTNEEYMAIDRQSLRSLEIRATLRDSLFQGSLLHAIRHTVTKSGARLLAQRLVSPSMSLSVINERLDLVEEMLHSDALREDVMAMLKRTHDTYRLLQKFAIGRGDADELLGLARTIELISEISSLLHDHVVNREDALKMLDCGTGTTHSLGCFRNIIRRLDLDMPTKVAKQILIVIDEESLNRKHMAEEAGEAEIEQMAEQVENADAAGESIPKLARKLAKSKALMEGPDSSVDGIWVMRRNASPTLDKAHRELDKLSQLKQDLTERLRKELKAESLTLKWTPGKGHFCHVKGRDAQGKLAALESAKVFATMKTSRSFHFADWTSLGAQIDNAKLRIRAEEERVFNKLRAEVLENLMRLRRNAAVLDELDVACSSAILAKTRQLVRPVLHHHPSHKIIGGRHPTVDLGLTDLGRSFTSNDCTVGSAGDKHIYLITGPNMGGKSTYLRQNALITILAQMGCFVPADYAEIGLVDKIFSRVGSADNLYSDQSTFMVEMLETAAILKQATNRSFVIMDEIGRGTTAEDGTAVSYACLQHLHYVNGSRVLFATHFHALADMTRDFQGLARYCTDIAELGNGSWSYSHRLRPGVNRESHALKVAQLAGMPEETVQVAAKILADLRNQRRQRKIRGGEGTETAEVTLKASEASA